jgi:hypothetical protein
MHLSKTFVAALFWAGALLAHTSHAIEGEEEPCPAFANQTGSPTCEECISSSCGYAVDHGDCVKDCATVTDTECFSLTTSNTTVVADICTMASAGGGGGEVEEAMCAAFETSGATPTCETCVEAGCGWTSDDGDCLKDCDEVNDGAECVSMSGSQTAASACGSSSGGTAGATSGAATAAMESAKAVVTLTLAAAASLLM